MSDVTRILSQIERGDPQAAERLLPLVYDELRKLAAVKLAQEKPGQTLQATALVHEAYVRLVDGSKCPQWNSRGHFFGAAAEAMRRILVDSARHKGSQKRSPKSANNDQASVSVEFRGDPAEILAIHELLDRLAAKYPRKAEVVKLRYFLNCSQKEAAEILGISEDSVHEDWVFARAWLKRNWQQGERA
jgi:RNA polymerase sigma factor (TIGR02999 family)